MLGAYPPFRIIDDPGTIALTFLIIQGKSDPACELPYHLSGQGDEERKYIYGDSVGSGDSASRLPRDDLWFMVVWYYGRSR